MPERKPQINFQVEDPLKLLYEEAKAQGHWVTRFCAAGFLLMVEDARARSRAISRLRDWEKEYAHASPKDIRDFVEGAGGSGAGRGARRTSPKPPPRPSRKKVKGG